ncbi:nucleotide sugar dehydrogenase [Pseudooceanicola nanhaiensis]|uniref:nucleotide sugar dehydrogenase n=1 Tax=Pseudooceanicola nanhaiensis TaxID=375761 RepID=UPI001CD49503|nr:nucleotide sugar dehydrogenase [Pseudooceanicola nanhaiensis]MCA0919165.1 nucleotide sugar dehydrogenase [Pseudooceanicola nanhaiensis]
MVSVSDTIAVIGMGYVGLPLAAALARSGADVVGFDVKRSHIESLQRGIDPNGEVSTATLDAAAMRFTDDPADLAQASIYIIAVPTPVTEAKVPDLGPIRAACAAIAPNLSRGDLVVVESTVYPGVTEDVCGAELEAGSGLRSGTDFVLGYSPERINPGDAEHSLEKVVKIIAAQDAPTLDRMEALYTPVARGGLYRASTIRTAEAAKIIENTQRDLNIALVNEFSLIFSRMGLDTLEVLEAAGTKWNFLPFRPGLVGGHCIGVDPYYLTYAAESLGYHPEVILSGRRINDRMGRHVARSLVKEMLARGMRPGEARVLVLGFTFKEDCADIRNTRVADIVDELQEFSVTAEVYDPRASVEAIREYYGIEALDALPEGPFDAVVLAVAHAEFRALGAQGVRALLGDKGLVYDVKGLFDRSEAELRL